MVTNFIIITSNKVMESQLQNCFGGKENLCATWQPSGGPFAILREGPDVFPKFTHEHDWSLVEKVKYAAFI